MLQVLDPRAEEKVDEKLGLLWCFADPQESFCSLSLPQWERGSGEKAAGVTRVLAELLTGRGCWAADMSWSDHNSRENLEVTGLGWKRVSVSGILAPSLTHQLCLTATGACEPSVKADVDDSSTASPIPFAFWKVNVWSQTLQLDISLCLSGFLGSLCILLVDWGRMGMVGARCWWSWCSCSGLRHHFKTYFCPNHHLPVEVISNCICSSGGGAGWS